MPNRTAETKDERSLLLYFETCAVDHSGLVDLRKMNAEDLRIAEEWNNSGFVEFDRMAFISLFGNYTHYVILSQEAWETVNQERQNRANRLLAKRTWLKRTEV